MRNRRRHLMLAVVVALLAGALPAQACSCVGNRDLREELIRSDGAMIGTFLSQEPTEDGGAVHTMRVEEAFKGDLGETVDVHSSGEHGMCGLHGSPGTRVGILLTRDPQTGVWEGHSCSVVGIEQLREAAAPLPEPDGRGGVNVLVGGSWGEVGHLALDRANRTLGYGTGNHQVIDLAACPDGRSFVEVYLDHGFEEGPIVALRRTVTNELLWERSLPPAGGDEEPVELGCSRGRDPAVLVATRTFDRGGPAGRVLRLREATERVVYEGELFDAAFGAPAAAYLQRGERGRELVEVRLGSGEVRRVGWTPAGPSEPALSPDARRLATITEGRVFVFDLVAEGARADRKVGAEAFGDVAWIGNRHLAYLPRCFGHGRIKVFDVLDSGLGAKRRIAGRWCADEVAVSGRVGYGLVQGGLYRVAFSGGGPATFVRRFQSPHLTQLAAVRGRPEIDWPAP